MSLSKGLSEEYFKFEEKYITEYGEKACILMAIGSFYDVLEYNPIENKSGKLEYISNILNVVIGGKKNTDIPNFIGFPKISISKYLPILLDHGFTVVIVDEFKDSSKIRRAVSGVYSSSIYPVHLLDTNNDSSLMCIYLELYKSAVSVNSVTCLYSICVINTYNNSVELYEKSLEISTVNCNIAEYILDDFLRIKTRYNISEILLYINDESIILKNLKSDYINDYLGLTNEILHIKYNKLEELVVFSKIDYQNEFFRSIYNNVNFGLINPITFMELEYNDTSRINLVYALKFISRHDLKYVENINLPKFINESEHLVLELNTLNQLNIVSLDKGKSNTRYSSLFDVLNKTSTTIGKRTLNALLCKPFKKHTDIKLRYLMNEEMDSKIYSKEFIDILENICDFQRLHRRMALGILHPYQLVNLIKTYNSILLVSDYIKSHSGTLLLLEPELYTRLSELLNKIKQTFDLTSISQISLSENLQIPSFFNIGIISELDNINNKIQSIQSEVETIRSNYENLISGNGEWVKLAYNENEGYYLTLTKIRTKLLENKMSDKNELDIKSNTNMCKISTNKLKSLSRNLVNYQELFLKQNKLNYINTLKEISNKNYDIFNKLSEYIGTIDVIKSNVCCKRLYKYCQPTLLEIDETSGSCIVAKSIRHPIIERINTDFEYIPNDISLTKESSGVILYALNSCGKSSLLRSIGLSIVMAQCGMYVPCSEFSYVPFSSVITQVDLHDNLWKGQSSFISEMIGLRRIMSLANGSCLVLSDELTKGTEVVSATSIFASSVLELIKKGCKFVFTTHLQDVAKLDVIKKCPQLSICHLSVDIKADGVIYFERKLKAGPCSELYGLEVAKAVGIPNYLLDQAFDIRNTLVGNKSVSKSSRYNKSKDITKCEICGYSVTVVTDIPLDTHHINFQCNADQNGFNDHFYKHSKFNLVCLCKSCHINVHKGNPVISGYKQTSNGKVLDYK